MRVGEDRVDLGWKYIHVGVPERASEMWSEKVTEMRGKDVSGCVLYTVASIILCVW